MICWRYQFAHFVQFVCVYVVHQSNHIFCLWKERPNNQMFLKHFHKYWCTCTQNQSWLQCADNFTLFPANVKFSIYWRKTKFTKADLLAVYYDLFDKMFNLFRKPQLANAFVNGIRIIRNPSAAGFCTEEPPRRIEKSKFTQQLVLRLDLSC